MGSSAESILLALLDHYCDDEDFAAGINERVTPSSPGAHEAGCDWCTGDGWIGAGATRGAQPQTDGQCLPPLNADFFTQLQRITRPKHIEAVKAVMRDVVELFGPNFSVSMEDYFTQLESIQRTVRRAAGTSPAVSPQEVTDKRSRLMGALAATLEESTDVSKRHAVPCERHRAIVRALRPRDTIISFNYDCVMDHALRTHGGNKWSARHGYALPKPARISGYENWDATNPPGRNRSAYLLKLHGSLNWQLPPAPTALTGTIRIKHRLYQLRGTPRFTMVHDHSPRVVEAGG